MAEKHLEGQVAVVTGAGSGIGKAVAKGLAQGGAPVVINYIGGSDAASGVVHDIESNGGLAMEIEADVSNEQQVQALFERTVDQFGRIDILINNAGIQQDAPFVEMTLEQWNKVLSVNLTGQFLCAREAARHFIRRGVQPEISRAAGKIISISSVHEKIPWSGHVNYAASKGGSMQLSKSMAQELAAHKIRVNSIAPGAIKTPINHSAWKTLTSKPSCWRKSPTAASAAICPSP